MGEEYDFSDDSSLDGELEAEIVAKNEPMDVEFFQSGVNYSRSNVEHGSSSSGSNARSTLLGMGFSPSLVDKVIEEKGDGDVDMLLEALFASSSIPNQKSDSSDSLDDLFDERDDASKTVAPDIRPKEEPDPLYEVDEEKKAMLLSMDFSLPEVDFALDKLGAEALVHDIVDFIFAARVAENLDQDPEGTVKSEEGDTNEETNVESLYQTMDITVRLLEMGFSENEVSAVIDKFGSERPISELAGLIVSGQIHNSSNGTVKIENGHDSYGNGVPNYLKRSSTHPIIVKKEEPFDDFPLTGIYVDGDRRGKRVKQEEFVPSFSSPSDPSWMRTKINSRIQNRFQRPVSSGIMKPASGSSVNKVAPTSPFFLYGTVVDLSSDSWGKVSKFLYAIQPEFVNTQLFSALNRKEGYVHNLPADGRLHVLPKSPLTIEEAVPQTKKWWPSWDTRKQLTNISSDTLGVYDLCDRLGKTLINSYGLPSPTQQREILHQCQASGLVWFGQNRLGPLEPEHLERILGYPLRHTQVAEWNLNERLQALKYCFQVDTLAYYLSVLRPMFPDGIAVLSVFSGIGGTELALHRLGIPLKGVVSLETCPTKRKILRKWWHDTDQLGELVQIEGVEKLTTTKLEVLAEMLGGFDLIVCQNPCTNSAKGIRISDNGDNSGAFDFSLFYEFVRVLQRVRSMLERRS